MINILVVDDDEDSRVYLEKALKTQGYIIEGAQNGAVALEKALKSLPDIIISDIMMPEMDGFELCRKVKTDTRLANIPFVFYTSTYSEKKDKELALSLGASKYVVKPVEMQDFFIIIKEVIEELKDKESTEPGKVAVEKENIDEMYSQAITRKLEKKVKELEESRQSYKTLAENLPGIVYRSYLREKNRVQFFNKAAKSIIGYSENELTPGEACSIDALILEQDHVKAVNIFNSAISGNKPFQAEYRIRHKDGSVRYMLDQGSVICGSDKKPLYIDGVIFDITQSKQTEEMLRLSREEALRASAVKSEFLSKMSHELRTPLNSIIGFSEILKTKQIGELNEKQEQYIDNVFTSGKLLLLIINDMLDLVNVESGEKLPLIPELFFVPEAIYETLFFLHEKANRKNIIITKEIDPELDVITADKIRFKQILLNLLENAIKFSRPEGGAITIEAKKVGDMAQFSVSDNGIGIRDEDIGKLFDLFHQIDSGMSRKYGGSGIGLAITKQLVEQHGGEIWAQSKYGQGSTFTFTLPLVAKKGG